MSSSEGILLYYYYTPLLGKQQEEKDWFTNSCSKLSLVGRVRCARDGVNVTIGGPLTSLKQHCKDVLDHFNLPPDNTRDGTCIIDFKLSESTGRRNLQAAIESKFTSLAVEICKEVVTIGVDSFLEDTTIPPDSAKHVSPQEFHSLLQKARVNDTVLIDCRNAYEITIGHFLADNVEVLNPQTRTFADLPAWMESNIHRIAGKKQILMCCTGGVRCERASSYLRGLSTCFQDDNRVVQLHGGIERYIQHYGTSGYFKGSNFVFDERCDVAPYSSTKEQLPLAPAAAANDNDDTGVVGMCIVCHKPWGHYGARARCTACRMLVLLCDTCNQDCGGDRDQGPSSSLNSSPLLCNLCIASQLEEHKRQHSLLDSHRKIRILCLHGFRQTAKNFYGRTCALRKRLKSYVDIEYVYLDGPHPLPHIVKKERAVGEDSERDGVQPRSSSTDVQQQKRHRRAWLVAPSQYNRNTYQTSVVVDRERIVDVCDSGTNVEFENFCPTIRRMTSDGEEEQYHHQQYQQQTTGWDETLELLNNALEDNQGSGGFDGVWGFSQGAAVAATLAALECRRPVEQRRFKFVILCSGYISSVPGHKELMQSYNGNLPMPSLHVYSMAQGQDGQVSAKESQVVWECFDPTRMSLLRHNSGHLIPSTRAAAARIADFLSHTLRSRQ